MKNKQMNTKRLTDQLSDLNAYQMAGGVLAIALVVSAIEVGIIRLIRTRMRSSAVSGGSDPDPLALQPAVDASMPVQVPHHFSEDLIVPGHTETGADVMQEDDTLGRSPEGV